jgi:hypothetical protein
MIRMRWLGLIGGLLLTSSGCCWWADKWCPQSHCAASPPPQACYPAPQCCQPCTPCTPYAPVAQPGPSGYQAWTPAPTPPPCRCP